jgi:hypothetical protein
LCILARYTTSCRFTSSTPVRRGVAKAEESDFFLLVGDIVEIPITNRPFVSDFCEKCLFFDSAHSAESNIVIQSASMATASVSLLTCGFCSQPALCQTALELLGDFWRHIVMHANKHLGYTPLILSLMSVRSLVVG